MSDADHSQKLISSRVTAISAVTLLLAMSLFLVAAPAATAAKAPKRVVALTPFAANTMALLGTQPVAVGQTLGGERRLAPVLNQTPKLPLTHPFGPNLEQLVRQKPDLVLTSPQWAKGTQAMRNLGMRVKNAEPTSIGQVYSQTRQIARIMKRKAKGDRLVGRIRNQIRRNTGNYKSRPEVMLILGVGTSFRTFLTNSWGGRIVRLAGGRLFTGGATAPSGFAMVGGEAIIDGNPDVIIAVPHANPEDIPNTVDLFKANPILKLTAAARNNRVYVSIDNSLLQAGTDIGQTIRRVRSEYLRN